MSAPRAYYNEVDKNAAQWIRNLISAGLVAPGDVDDRDIRDVTAADLAGYTQCHFFAGIGLWSYALRQAGWDDSRPIWTGSCPCQPFSQAGKGDGFADERHLWPAWEWLIRQLLPEHILGEQVEGPAGRLWIDLVSGDLENSGYACGPTVLCSAGIGAPNIRERLYWMADADGGQRDGIASREGRILDGTQAGRHEGDREHEQRSSAGRRLGNASGAGLPHPEPSDLFGQIGHNQGRAVEQPGGPFDPWRELEWIACRDGKSRPTQSVLLSMAPRDSALLGFLRSDQADQEAEARLMLHPLRQRRLGDVAKLRAYGNAINPVLAAEFIRACMETIDE